MQQAQIAEAKAQRSALAGPGRSGARLISGPKTGRNAAEVLRDAWSLSELDIESPAELPVDCVNLD